MKMQIITCRKYTILYRSRQIMAQQIDLSSYTAYCLAINLMRPYEYVLPIRSNCT